MIFDSAPNEPRGPVAKAIENRLQNAFKPTRLTLIDESHRHAGHAGAHSEGESHFRAEIVSAAFAGLGRVARQRAVNEALADLLAERVHAFSMKALTPDEDRA